MTSTGLIVFLPVVAAFVGAIIGAWANSWYRNKEVKKAQDQEREGLLVLISVEVATNIMIFNTFIEHLDTWPDADNRTNVAKRVHTLVWEESSAKLAQLLPSWDIASIALYYRRIDYLRLRWTAPSRELSAEDDAEYIHSMREQGVKVIQIAQAYISNPDFAAEVMGPGRSDPPDTSNETNPA